MIGNVMSESQETESCSSVTPTLPENDHKKFGHDGVIPNILSNDLLETNNWNKDETSPEMTYYGGISPFFQNHLDDYSTNDTAESESQVPVKKGQKGKKKFSNKNGIENLEIGRTGKGRSSTTIPFRTLLSIKWTSDSIRSSFKIKVGRSPAKNCSLQLYMSQPYDDAIY